MYRTTHKCTVRLAGHSLVSLSQGWVSGKAQIDDGVRLDPEARMVCNLRPSNFPGPSLWNT